MSFCIKPPFWQPSPHSTIPRPIYRLAANKVVDRWLLGASQVDTLWQARRDLARLSIAAFHIGQMSIAQEARQWSQCLPVRPPLYDPLGSKIRQFFSRIDETEDLMWSIASSDRALSVFDQNEIAFLAEELAAQEDKRFIVSLLSTIPDGSHLSQFSSDLARLLWQLGWI